MGSYGRMASRVIGWAAALAASQAQAQMMAGATQPQAPAPSVTASEALPGYLVVVGKATDRARIGTYAASLGPIYGTHNGGYLAVGAGGRGVRWLEGPWADRSLVIARFVGRSDIDAFWWGEPYRAAIRLRDRAGVFSVVALDGQGVQAPPAPGSAYLLVMSGAPSGTPAAKAALERADAALRAGVARSGGAILTAPGFSALEGDTLFDRVVLASWPSAAARDAWLASREARAARRLREKAGLSVVAAADGFVPPGR